jgi:hypothetical protein
MARSGVAARSSKHRAAGGSPLLDELERVVGEIERLADMEWSGSMKMRAPLVGRQLELAIASVILRARADGVRVVVK